LVPTYVGVNIVAMAVAVVVGVVVTSVTVIVRVIVISVEIIVAVVVITVEVVVGVVVMAIDVVILRERTICRKHFLTQYELFCACWRNASNIFPKI
jgi:hypothetical protein